MDTDKLEREIGWVVKEKYGGRKDPGLAEDIQRLKSGEPVDYVIGWCEFLGLKIDLSKRPLVPRDETEEWVGKVVESVRQLGSQAVRQLIERKTRTSDSRQIRVLDIFAGSGCIGIAVLKHLPHVIVDFGEKEARFVEQIRINAELNRITADRYHVIQSDLFANLPNSYDLILANPPYVARNDRRNLSQELLRFEPEEALLGGPDGLVAIRRLLKEAPEHLYAEGKIYLEFGYDQKERVTEILREFGYRDIQFFRDQFGVWRWLTVGRLLCFPTI